MEIERALFRVYERSLEGCSLDYVTYRVGENDAASNRTCMPQGRFRRRMCYVNLACYLFAMLFFSMTITVHVLFVDKAGCFNLAINNAAKAWIATGTLLSDANSLSSAQQILDSVPDGAIYSVYPEDTVFRLAVDISQTDFAVGTFFPGQDPLSLSKSPVASINDEQSLPTLDFGLAGGVNAARLPWCTLTTNATISCQSAFPPPPNPSLNGSTGSFSPTNWVWSWGQSMWTMVSEDNSSFPTVPQTQLPSVADDSSNPFYPMSFSPDFLVSGGIQQLTMGQRQRSAHGYPVVNVTIPASCTGGTPSVGSIVGWLFFGYEEVAINSAMLAFPKRTGYLAAAYSGEYWSWSPVQGDTELSAAAFYIMKFVSGVGRAALILAVYATMTTVCAFFVRTIITYGPSLLYPIIALCAACPCFRNNRFAHEGFVVAARLLSAAYPWVGSQVRQLRVWEASEAATGQPMPRAMLTPQRTNLFRFFAVHLSCVFVACIAFALAVMYTQTWVMLWLSHPAGLSTGLWVWMLITDYCCVVWLRSRASISLFPRIHLILFALFYLYYTSFDYPASSFAFLTVSALSLAVLGTFVAVYEVPAVALGHVSFDKPRYACVRTPSPQSSLAVPALWTVLHPLNSAWPDLRDEVNPTQPVRNDAPTPIPPVPAPPAGVVVHNPVADAAAPDTAAQHTQPLLVATHGDFPA